MSVLIVALALFAAQAPAPATATVRPDPTAANPDICSVSVKFSSYAMGIDEKGFERVESYLARGNRLIVGSVVRPWGREGERTVCITTASARDANRIFTDMKGMVGGRGARGPTEVRTREGRIWKGGPKAPKVAPLYASPRPR
ncbi:hypothetical protein [Caulobacter mirabilis]|uniref:Uncharacterized protein n=1 Tax=Caulobacter mirabilis TaxID=69666 RepID=A0A2D2AVJ8_9CAUL|nr:hypothetical protein [Caulobacter mirabilis]ATQ42042.1 hypothetical protein CSW64_06240 [Caulobacter mirabilis]